MIRHLVTSDVDVVNMKIWNLNSNDIELLNHFMFKIVKRQEINRIILSICTVFVIIYWLLVLLNISFSAGIGRSGTLILVDAALKIVCFFPLFVSLFFYTLLDLR